MQSADAQQPLTARAPTREIRSGDTGKRTEDLDLAVVFDASSRQYYYYRR